MEQDKSKVKEMKMHKESFFMYEKTKQECYERMLEAMNPDGSKRWTQEDIDEKIKMIQTMQDDVRNKYIYAGGNPEDLIVSNTKDIKTQSKRKISISKKANNKTEDVEKTEKPVEKKRTPIVRKEKVVEEVQVKTVKEDIEDDNTPMSVVPNNWSINNFNESFDVIPLPSKGECYEDGMKSIPVAYLTANDENMIVSPNLYRDGLILDYLLKAKIKNVDIDPDDLLEGDREAIILWLRATSYGTRYPITVTDNKTGINFDTEVDLTQIKHKPFVLKGDGDGCFNYTLPVSKDEVKFRFLTHGDIKQLQQIEIEEQTNVKKERLVKIAEELNDFIEGETILNKDEKIRLYEAKRNISKWADKLEVDNDLGYTNSLTNRLELSVVSINGNTNREFISDYISNMPVMDALSIRKYITENEPGLDYAVTVERPESLGGGSMPVFLELDEYVFLNIAQ